MIFKPNFFRSTLLLLCFLSLQACKENKRPDISGITLDLKIERFDQEMKSYQNSNVMLADSLLKKNYGMFYTDYVHKMVGDQSTTGPFVLNGIFQDTAYRVLSKEVDSVYPNLKKQEEELTTAFKYIKHYYPKLRTPRFIAFVSGFAYQIPLGDNYLGIGLDMFLGSESTFYDALVASIPKYQSRKFTPTYIVPRVTEVFAREEMFRERDEDQTLLSKMIYNGKILYFLDQVLPENTPDSVKIGYTSKQMEWVNNFEGNIWAFFLDQELLYQSDMQVIQRYLTDGPFTPGIGDKKVSAPKLGVFLGWRIVKKYMDENPKISLQQLMDEVDAQKILTKSKYKPREG